MTTAALPPAKLELAAPPANPPVRSHVIGGIAVIGLMFGCFGFWAATAPLTSAAVAAPMPTRVNASLQCFCKKIIHVTHRCCAGDGIDGIMRRRLSARRHNTRA